MIKVVASIFILLSAALASPALRVNVTKSKFLFIKWANFTPALHTADKDTVSTSSASKWYVFANYYGKIQSGDLGVAIQYKFNDDKDYTSAATNKDATSTDDLLTFTSGVETSLKCINPDTAELTTDSVSIVENAFNVYITVKCEAKILSKVVEEIVEDVNNVVNKLAGSKKEIVPPAGSKVNAPAGLEGSKKLIASLKGSKVNVPAVLKDSKVNAPVQLEGSKVNVPANLEGSKKLLNASKQVLNASKQALNASKQASQKEQVIPEIHESQKLRIVL